MTRNSIKAPGDIDHEFGIDGLALFTFSPYRANTKRLADGNILTAGAERGRNELVLFRHLASGAIDTAFGEQGVVRITVPYPPEFGPIDLFIQPDGNAVVSSLIGNPAEHVVIIMRFSPDGILDTSFGVSGFCILSLGEASTSIRTLDQLADGKLLVTLRSMNMAGLVATYLARLENGHLDPSFGENGTGLVHIGGASVNDLVLLPSGGCLVVGEPADFEYSSAVLRQFLPDGNPDLSFGSQGVVTLNLPGESVIEIKTLLRQPDGKIVASGTGSVGFGFHTLITRINADGSMDTGFNDGEPKLMVFQGHEVTGYTAMLQPDGRIITGGGSQGSVETSNFVLMRFMPNASLDGTFGNNGQVMSDFAGLDRCEQLELESDGAILASGLSSMNTQGTWYVLTRYFI